MMKTKNKRMKTETLVLAALMTALVAVFQYLGTATTFFGPFATAVALIPIIVGTAMCGTGIGAWLGFVFAIVVFFTGGANLFFPFSIHGTIITVLTKGIACGYFSGLFYKLLKNKSKTLATYVAALSCPVINTSTFLLGSALFFMPAADQIASAVGISESGFGVFVALAFGNFLFEIIMCVVLAPVIVRVLNMRKKK